MCGVTSMAEATPAQPVYEGPRKNGRMEGYGKYTFTTGTVYTGQFLDGEFHGEVSERRGGCSGPNSPRPRCTENARALRARAMRGEGGASR